MCVLYDYRYGIFVCKCVSVFECKLCYILYMLLYKGSRGRQQLLSWSLNFLILTFIWISHVNFLYIIYIYVFSVWRLKINSILFYSRSQILNTRFFCHNTVLVLFLVCLRCAVAIPGKTSNLNTCVYKLNIYTYLHHILNTMWCCCTRFVRLVWVNI